MPFITLAGLSRRNQGALLFLAVSTILVSFAIACVTDLNHPPGTRAVRIAALVFVAAIGLLEFKRPWIGLAIFAALWPQRMVLKLALENHFSPLFAAWPDVFDWPCTAALAAAIALRHFRTIPPDPLSLDANTYRAGFFAHFLPLAFWVLILTTLASVPFSYLKLKAMAPEWGLLQPDFRALTSNHPLSVLRPFNAAIPLVVHALFTLIVLRAALFERTACWRIYWPLFGFVLGLFAAALQLLTQIAGTGAWVPLDEGAPSGPFGHRNMAAPMLILAAWALLAIRGKIKLSNLTELAPVAAILLVLLAICTGSRNALILTACSLWSLLFIGAGKARTLLAFALPAVLLVTVLYLLPLPRPDSGGSQTLRRSVDTLQQIRDGEWMLATSFRTELWKVGGRMWLHNPVVGAGPGTFYIYANRVGYTHSPFMTQAGVASFAAHSVPMNLLAECGPLAALAWLFIFLMVPFAWIVKTPTFHPLATGLFLFGLSNLLDTPWYAEGTATLFGYWLALAASEENSRDAAFI